MEGPLVNWNCGDTDDDMKEGKGREGKGRKGKERKGRKEGDKGMEEGGK